jgi:hypothetical protein
VAKRSADQELAEMVTRNWFEQRLITPGGVRDQLLMAAGSSGGLENWIIDRLEDAHLVRKDRRRGRTWIELAHDRLVTPVRQNNNDWFRGRRLGSLRKAAPWLIGSALTLVPFLLFPGQADSMLFPGRPDWTSFLMLVGASVLVFVLSFLLTTLLMRQLAMRERSMWIYKGSRVLGLILAVVNTLITLMALAVILSASGELKPILVVAILLAVIGACMLFIVVSFAGANALGTQIARLRLPHGLGFFAAFLVIFILIFLCIGLLLVEAFS